jgi:hypothetical protein
MDVGTVSGLLGVVVGTLLGGGLSIASVLLSRRAERRSSLNKIIAEKRLNAYEEVIAFVRWASIGISEDMDKKPAKWPIVFENSERLDEWAATFPVVSRKTSHLVHEELAYEMWVLHDYLQRLSTAYLKNIGGES